MSTLPISKPLLVGESNPYGSDPHFALYPAPDGCAGERLCRLVLGMHRRDYMESFERVNLCDGAWLPAEASRRAVQLIAERAGSCRIILLGSRVCGAFGVPFLPYTVVDEVLLRLPHPSGLSRAWNEPGGYRRAREAVTAFVPELAHLIGRLHRGE